MTGRDLGTYWVRAEYGEAGGFWYQYETGGRFNRGTDTIKPLTAQWMPPTWESEADLFSSIRYQFTEGNYSCDCNVRTFMDAAAQRNLDEPVEYPCAGVLRLTALAVQCPDGRMVDLLQKNGGEGV